MNMSILMEIFVLLLLGFAGYVLGRLGHIYGGHLNWFPHHWIPGLIMIVAGAIFYYNLPGRMTMFFGLGLFISDFLDFLELKIMEPDKPGPKRFWHID
jgi:hypothetical protein